MEPVSLGDSGLTVLPTDTPSTLPDPDLIVVPGSENPLPVMDDQVLVEWLRTPRPKVADASIRQPAERVIQGT